MTNQQDAGRSSDNEGELATSHADTVAEDDPHKVEKLTKAGRDLDPNADGE